MFHVKQTISLEQFNSFAGNVGIGLNRRQKEQLQKYLELILFWSRKQNLVSKNDLNFIIERHYIPSLFLCSVLSSHSDIMLADVGSGAGFPGVLIQIVLSNFKVTLIDSSRKKYLFLREVIDSLALNSLVLYRRIEEISEQSQQKYDVVVSRATAQTKILLRWTERLINPDGRLVLIKGADVSSEIQDIDQNRVKVNIIKPGAEWIQLSQNLESKRVIVMEKKNV
jgi:16S rRNA (guanine527-N7)-methyltransferase